MIGKAMQLSNRLLDQFRNLLPTTHIHPDANLYHYAMSRATKEQCELIIWEALVEEYQARVSAARRGKGFIPPLPKFQPIAGMYGLNIMLDEGLVLGQIVVRKVEAVS